MSSFTPYLEIFVAAVITMLIGYVWYMPKVFGDRWLKEVHLKKDAAMKKGMMTAMIVSFICYLVTGFVVFQLVNAFDPSSIGDLLWLIFWLWIGFVGAVRLSHSLFEQKSMTYFWISSLHDLASILAMGLVFWLWK